MTKSKNTMQWDLSEYYSGINDPKIQKDLKECDTHIQSLQKYRGKIAQLTPKEMLDLITTWEKSSVNLYKVAQYAGLMDATHVGISEVTRFVKKVDEELVARSKETIFISVECSKLTESQWQKLLKAPELKAYRKTIHNLYIDTKYTLSEPEEKILTEKSQTSNQALNHLFEITTNTLTVEWDKKTITLEELLNFLRDPDSKTRKKAAFKLHEVLKTNSKTTPAIFNSLVQDKSINDRLRGLEYPEHSRYLSEDVDKETVEALIKAVNGSSDLVKKYYELKKKIFKTNTFYWWDRYAPLPKSKTKISPEQAKQMVLDSFYEFAPEAGEAAAYMFDKKHIDWLPSSTKRGGAFCAYGINDEIYPYILLNYTEGLGDVTTLAHEMGHAFHDVLAQRNNVHFESHASLALAEIASTFGESMLVDKLLASDISKEDKINILMEEIEGNFATIHRQISMFQFEQTVHNKRAKEGELSKEQLDDLWAEIMEKPFKDALIYTPEHKNTWMYVTHVFASPFYVFSYAFAQLCTLALYKQYKEQGKAFVPKYLEILKAGGSLSPKENLAQAGLDITKPKFWKDGLAIVEKQINVLAELVS